MQINIENGANLFQNKISGSTGAPQTPVSGNGSKINWIGILCFGLVFTSACALSYGIAYYDLKKANSK